MILGTSEKHSKEYKSFSKEDKLDRNMEEKTKTDLKGTKRFLVIFYLLLLL